TYHKFHNLTLEQIDYWNSQGMIWDYQEYKNSQKKDLETKQSTLEKYTKLFHNDSEKAACVVSCLKVLREKRSSRQKEDYHIDNILAEFDIDLETLQSYLERTRTRDSKEKAEPMKYKEGTLRRFCIDNGYNYDVVRRAIKLHDFCQYDSLEQLINRSLTSYKENGQKEPATWVYEKYGTLIKHVLLKLNLDSTSILTNMTKSTISLEEAIRHEIFLKNKENRYNDWLEQPYNYLIEQLDANKKEPDLIEDIVTAYQSLLKEYHITIEESAILLNSFMQYIETIKGYHKIDVGLETDMTKKLEKIKMYNLEEIDIEDSFFIPLEFEKGVLLGKTSKLYQRRQLLRQYIIDWDLYSLEEKEMIKLHNSFTEEEMKMIEFSRIEINNILEQTKSL
ncbi:MAG: hypothetical protein PUB18_01485, partial [bacterium]|nr:hypothetical protein [bacterium]